MTDNRMDLALEFEKLSNRVGVGVGVGVSLGVWAGRGDWASMSQDYRDRQGQRSLTELDTQITQLTEFRERLAAAVAGDLDKQGGTR